MESLDLHIYIFSFIFATFLNHKIGEYMTKNNKTLRMKRGEKIEGCDVSLLLFIFFSAESIFISIFWEGGGGSGLSAVNKE